MGFLDWLLGKGGEVCDGDPRLAEAVARVIDATDPRLRLLEGVRERLCPAVTHALDYADQVAAALPPCIATLHENHQAIEHFTFQFRFGRFVFPARASTTHMLFRTFVTEVNLSHSGCRTF